MRESDRLGSYWLRKGDGLKEREIDREREGEVKQMCQNCIPTMNMNTLLNCVYTCLLYNWKFSKVEVVHLTTTLYNLAHFKNYSKKFLSKIKAKLIKNSFHELTIT